MSEGQKTMLVAVAYPTPEKGGRGKNSAMVADFAVHSGRLSKARAVLAESEVLADAVIEGTKTLEEAHRECREVSAPPGSPREPPATATRSTSPDRLEHHQSHTRAAPARHSPALQAAGHINEGQQP